MKRSHETEKKILRSALELFVRRGYHGTSIKNITQKVGLTKGALYSHFSSKGELLLRIIDQYRHDFLHEMMRAVTGYQGDAAEKLHRAISFNSKFALQNQDLCIFLTFLTTELNADVDFEPPLRNLYQEHQKFISQLIQRGIKQGLFKKDLDPDLTALTFIAFHDGVLHQWILNRSFIDGEQYVKTFRTVFMEGIKA